MSSIAALNQPFILRQLAQSRDSGQEVDADESSDRDPSNPQLSSLVDDALASFGDRESRVRGPLDSFLGLLPPGEVRGSIFDELQEGSATLEFDPPSTTEERLEQIDPKVARKFQELRELVARLNPKAAEVLDRLIQSTLDHLNQTQPSADPAASFGQGQSFSLRYERIEIAVENTTTQIRADAEGGELITSRRVVSIYYEQLEITFGQEDPLVLDLNDNGLFDTTTPEDGHLFDLGGIGEAVQSATVTNGDALLALDRNGNGLIDDGTELFGDQNGAPDGFAELALLDANNDNRVDQNDPLFDRLLAFEDKNRNGRSEKNELQSLAEVGIEAFRLDAEASDEVSNGNHVVAASEFERADGTTGRIGELLFQYLA